MEERSQSEPAVQNLNVEQFLNDLKAVVRDGQEFLKVSLGGVKTRAADTVRSTEQRVRDNPTKSMAMVFGIGVLVGVLAVAMMSGDDK